MYKLKDIFTLNLNTRGGVKLFNKIANKYNLHKEDRKDLMNLEVGSSSTTSNVKYYSFDPDKNEFSDTGIEILSQIVTSVKGVYYENGKYYSILPTWLHNSTMEYPFDRVVRCKIDYDVEIINYWIGKDENGNYMYVNSLYDYFSQISIIIGVSSPEELLSKLGLTECTKEEFYDLTKK